MEGSGVLEIYSVFKSLDDRCRYVFDIIQKNGPIAKSELIDMRPQLN